MQAVSDRVPGALPCQPAVDGFVVRVSRLLTVFVHGLPFYRICLTGGACLILSATFKLHEIFVFQFLA